MKIRIKRFDKSLPLPEGNETDPNGRQYPPEQIAGFDLLCREDAVIAPGRLALVPVNNAIQTPPGCMLLIFARSSTPWKKGLMLANGVGIIDPFFNGDKDEIQIQLYNITDKPVTVKRGEALAQGVIVRREPVEWEETDSISDDGHGGYQH